MSWKDEELAQLSPERLSVMVRDGEITPNTARRALNSQEAGQCSMTMNEAVAKISEHLFSHNVPYRAGDVAMVAHALVALGLFKPGRELTTKEKVGAILYEHLGMGDHGTLFFSKLERAGLTIVGDAERRSNEDAAA